MIAHIRGSLGSQLACYLAWASTGPIAEIRLNIGGKIARESTVDYLTDILDACPPVVKTDGKTKADLSDIGVLRRIVRQAAHVKLSRPIKQTNQKILHKRLGDRQTTSNGTYERLVPSYHIVLSSTRSIDVAVDDWFRLVNAREVCSSMSLFPITAAMFNPNMHLDVLEPDGPIKMNDRATSAFKILIAEMPNASWITL